MINKIVAARPEAISLAIDNLARYKYDNFGYHAAAYVHYNNLLEGTPEHMNNTPFINLVNTARTLKSKYPRSGE